MNESYTAIRETWVRHHEDDILHFLGQDLTKVRASASEGLITRHEFARIARAYIRDAVASITEVHDRLLGEAQERLGVERPGGPMAGPGPALHARTYGHTGLA